MKNIIKIGFTVWAHNHCGMRQIVDSRRHQLRRHLAFRVAMMVRRSIIVLGY